MSEEFDYVMVESGQAPILENNIMPNIVRLTKDEAIHVNEQLQWINSTQIYCELENPSCSGEIVFPLEREKVQVEISGDKVNFTKGRKWESQDDSSQCSPHIIKQNNYDWNYSQAYQESSSVVHKGTTEDVKIALINVVEMAKEYINNTEWFGIEKDKVIADDSINLIRKHLESIEDTNAMLAKADQIEIKTTK